MVKLICNDGYARDECGTTVDKNIVSESKQSQETTSQEQVTQENQSMQLMVKNTFDAIEPIITLFFPIFICITIYAYVKKFFD